MWTQHEDILIEEGVRKFGEKWRQIASTLDSRSDSSVRNRWMRMKRDRGHRSLGAHAQFAPRLGGLTNASFTPSEQPTDQMGLTPHRWVGSHSGGVAGFGGVPAHFSAPAAHSVAYDRHGVHDTYLPPASLPHVSLLPASLTAPMLDFSTVAPTVDFSADSAVGAAPLRVAKRDSFSRNSFSHLPPPVLRSSSASDANALANQLATNQPSWFFARDAAAM